MARILGLLLLAAVAVSGCAAGPGPAGKDAGSDQPGLADYPDSRYMSVIAVGDSEPEARRRALSELAGVFESDIRSRIDTRAESVIDDESENFSKTVSETIRIKTSVRLPGARIAETWQADGNHHAMAVLDKASSRRIWTEQIEAVDLRMAGEKKAYLNNRQNRLLQLRSANTILSLWIEKQVLKSRLRVIDVPYPEAFGEDDVEAIIEKLPELLTGLRLYIGISGRHGETVRDRIAEGLTREGFILTDQENGADVLILGKSSVEQLDMDRREWQFVRATISADIMDVNNGSTVAEVAENVRAAHISYGEASQKAVHLASERITAKIAGKFMNTGE